MAGLPSPSASSVPLVWGEEIATELVHGAPCRTFVDRPRHLRELLDAASRYQARAHLVDPSRSVAFADLWHDTVDIAGALAAAGARPGGRVVLLGRNSIDWVLTFWACVAHGWVVVPANAWWSRAQMDEALATVEPDVIVADAGGRGVLATGLPVLELEDLLVRGAGALPVPPPSSCDEDELAVVLFTSGTSGTSKAVGLSHRGLIAAIHNIVGRDVPGQVPTQKVALLTVPLFHIGGLQQVLLAAVKGTTLAFLNGRFDPVEALDLIEQHRVASWAAVPTMVSRVVDELERSAGDWDVSGLRALTMGASAVPAALRARVGAHIPSAGGTLSAAYGLTEAGGALAAASGPVLDERAGTVGRVLRTVEVRIEDPDAAGIGRIWVRSPSLMVGYLGSEEQPIDEDRWLDTGDLGRVDEDGFLYVDGRAKDIVIRGGENVSCGRVERRLLEHPAVEEAAVVGLPDEDLGERVAAAIVLRAGTYPSTADLAAFAADTLPSFEVPTTWWLRDELPKTATGKVVKRDLVAAWPPAS